MFNVVRSEDAPPSLAEKKSWTGPDVIKALSEIFHDKCYICETKNPLSLNVEHFDAHQGDEEKKYDWKNLYYCCARCNGIKRHFFNNLIDCTDPGVDALRLIRHCPPATPFTKSLLIEAMSQDPKTVETAKLVEKVFNEANTGNKDVSSAYLRRSVYKKYSLLVAHMNKYIDEDSLPHEKDDAVLRIKNLMGKTQEYSAFLRWAILESPDLLELVGDSID